MALTSRLTSAGDFLVTNQFDEYTLPSSSYATVFSGSQYLSTPNSNAFALTGNFTIECWAYFNNFSDYRTVIGMYAYGAYSGEWIFQHITGTSKMGFYLTTIGSITSGPTTLSTNTWYHIAMVRSGTTITAYINGVSQGTLTSSATIGYNNGPLYIGAPQNIGSARMNGFISNVRIVNGTALYTSAFTPPISPLTAITNTSFLTCQNPTIIDNSTNALTITNNGTATTTNVPSTFYSGLFNGSSQYLTGGGGSTSLYLDGAFTIEFWINGSGGGFYRYMFSKLAAYTATNNVSLAFRNGNGTAFAIFRGGAGGSAVVFSGGTVTDGVWYHIAIVRNSASSLYKVFINGVGYNWAINDNGVFDYSTFTIMGNPNDGGSSLAQTATGGYLSNLRVVKGTALYTTNFTPPTRQLTAVAGTSLLTLQSPTIIDKSNTPLTITNNGTAVVKNPISWNTVKREFSDGTFQTFNDIDEYTLPNSVYATQFNGSSQYLSLASNAAFQPGSGSFSIEAWIYPLNTSQGCIAFFGGTTSYWGIRFERNSGGGLQVLLTTDAASWQINYTAGSVTNNVWSHVALVKNGTSVLIFLNGVQVGTTQTISGSVYTGGTLNQIGVCYNVNYFNGYISNFRFVKGTALYTAAFTPSIAPLTAITNTSLLTCQNPTIIDNSTNAFTITNNGSATTSKVTTGASFIQTKSRLFSDGVLQVANSFDEYSISVLNVDYLVAAGGGGGAGYGLNVGGAGGGAGGLLTGSSVLARSVLYTVVIGSGGATGGNNASGGNGSDSSFTGTGISVTSKGGGKGGFWNNEAGNGGSGGGSTGGAGTVAGKGVYPGSTYLDAPRQGYDGALGSGNLGYTASTGGGGGGAGGAGSGSTGGTGVASSITGTSVTYCAGGSGGSYSSASPGSAALGCGGRGAYSNFSELGGSGVVIIRFPEAFPPTSTTGSPTVTNTGGYKIYQWTSSGSITF